jgi:cellulose synthase/poly-beta-1,6-N-acetylglucosamine synthase-like glycosyltransferase
MTFYLSLAGLAVLLYRLQPWLRSWGSEAKRAEPSRWPFVSIVVPCRNEEANLPSVLASLNSIDYPHYEVLVIDDHSTDGTFHVASEIASRSTGSRLRVIRAPEKPQGWGGKNWACWAGAAQAEGELFLFTDADTVHNSASLRQAVGFMALRRSDMISAPPFHACQGLWEKCLGSFQLFPFVATAYRQPPTDERLFAIGQYLLFTRESYLEVGGHSALPASLAEDVDLAHLWRNHGYNYQVYPQSDLYSVQMYATPRTFLAGWRRLLRLGLARSNIASVMEIAVVVHLLTCGFGTLSWPTFILFGAGIAVVAWAQSQIGRFWLWGALFAPLNALLFIGLTLTAVVDKLRKREIVWRNRAYPL